MGETMGSLSVSRRDVLKVSALGAAALALPFERVARAKTASKIAESKIQWGYEAWTSCHLHGSASKPQFDGYASDITRVGQTKTYEFPNNQESRTLWYHDHSVHHTAENAYMGLAAMYLMSDELEDRLPIPKGSYDLPMVIADKMFAANGSLMYDDEGHSGLYGDVMLVNGQPWPNLK